MNENQRWKARRDRAKKAVLVSAMQRTLSEVCKEYFPDWTTDRVNEAWATMLAEGTVDEWVDLAQFAQAISEQKNAALAKALRERDGDA